MDPAELRDALERLAAGETGVDDTLARLRHLPFSDLGFARVDHHRHVRIGLPEAVYGPGKTPAEAAAIVADLHAAGRGPVVLTRADPEQVDAALGAVPGGSVTPAPAGTATLVWRPAPPRPGRVLVVSAGTADGPVAAECTAVLGAYGHAARRVDDVGVAGVHRILGHVEDLTTADVVVVVAGMEGALASLVGGITPAPVVAVPTSVGYGAGLQGVTALLAMLASCAPGVCVVGIDNGFGAACAAARLLGRLAGSDPGSGRPDGARQQEVRP